MRTWMLLCLLGFLLTAVDVPAAVAEPAPSGTPEATPASEVAEDPSRLVAVIPETCTYRSKAWSVKLRRFVEGALVSKPYVAVTGEERSPDHPRCTVCEEDQDLVRPADLGLAGIAPFLICRDMKARVQEALQKCAREGDFDIVSLIGYRPGRTRGPVVNGLHTTFSNHAYGMAVDINSAFNGLYGRCNVLEVTPKSLGRCRLQIGGAWDPVRRPRTTITRQSSVYRMFSRFWRWGGEIQGDQRDLMHFSAKGL